MQAVIQTGGKQYVVAQGDKLLVGKIEGEKGTDITFDDILLVTGETSKIGTPQVVGAKVQAKILEQTKSKKVLVFKYKRRKGFHKTRGHRQDYTRVEITSIQA